MYMKLIYTLLLTSTALLQCKQPTAQATQNQPVTATAQAVTPISLAHVPKASASKTAYLGTGLWHCVSASRPGEDKYTLLATDLRFATDGTVAIMQGDTQLGTGTWAFDDAQNMIYISSSIAQLNSSWKVLDKGFRMIWLGNTDINTTGVQIRWDSYKM
jgi:hypothetical protein